MMELRQQIEKWEQERKDAHPESRADMDVAKRLLAHGIEALDRIAQLKTDLAAAQAEAAALREWQTKLLSAYERGIITSSDGTGMDNLIFKAIDERDAAIDAARKEGA